MRAHVAEEIVRPRRPPPVEHALLRHALDAAASRLPRLDVCRPGLVVALPHIEGYGGDGDGFADEPGHAFLCGVLV